jgi:hypothetical protein
MEVKQDQNTEGQNHCFRSCENLKSVTGLEMFKCDFDSGTPVTKVMGKNLNADE